MTVPTRNPFDQSVRPLNGITATACQDYAGAFSCGARQEGFDIVAKTERKDKFGMSAWLHNRDFLAPNLRTYAGAERELWPMTRSDVVFGNPPCSGFSILTRGVKWQEAGLHGAEAKQNECMRDLVNHAVTAQASVVVFESVPAAASTGLVLMEFLHNTLEEQTGEDWHMTLVRLNAMSVGGFPDRKRFFFVASRLGPVSVPAATGIEHSLGEAIGDLQDMVDDDPLSPYSVSSSKKAWRNGLLSQFEWAQGTSCAAAYEKAVANGYDGPVPDRSDLILNSFTSWRWRWDRPARVATGAVLDTVVHPIQNRTLTHAEVGRIMGFPKEYDLRGITQLKGDGRKLYGKGIPAQTGRWIMEGVRRHLENEDLPTDVDGVEFADRRYRIDVTNAWRVNKPTWTQPTIWESDNVLSVGA
jgi:site-specific DNA-cytosine methylase